MPAKVLYWGDLPPELASPNLQPASEATDLAFLRGSGEAYRIVRRYYVPVAAIGAAVDALTLTQMEDLEAGGDHGLGGSRGDSGTGSRLRGRAGGRRRGDGRLCAGGAGPDVCDL